MAAILHFRDLKCWQNALALNTNIFQKTNHFKCFPIRDQIQRAAISVMNNIAEGFGRKSPRERLRFFEYASSSCYEIENMTYLIENLELLTKDEVLQIRNSTVFIYKMLVCLSLSIKERNRFK
jgi:four helix bundle protein